jgi:ribonuclease HI
MTDFDYIIYTDGGGASSVVGGRIVAVKTEDSKTPTEILYRTNGNKMTCNEAEYSAVLLALERLEYHTKVKVLSDSMLVVNQLAPEKPWKINFEHLRILNSLVKDVITNLELDVTFEYIPRDHNLAGLFLEGKLKPPQDIIQCIE